MKPATAIAFTLVLVVGITAGAQGSWSAHTSTGEYAFARGDIDRAESEFRAALEIAQGLPAGDRRLETSLENLARLYEHQRVRRMAGKARRVMTGIFRAYMEDPRQMPPHVVAKADSDTPMPRVIADYIAGMTDRFAFEEYNKLYDPFVRV